MMRKLISWLSFMMAFCLVLLSCVHDEIYTSSDPASKEYHSKSLWKEDEKYIKNVMKIYSEHYEEIKKGAGEPMWDYAMTMDRFYESFLMVPVAEHGKVVAVLNVPRKGQRVYFTYTQVQNDMAFFQNLMSSRLKRAETTLMDNTAGKLVCTTKTISMFYPDNESDPDGPGHWESHHVTECKSQQLESCVGEVLPDGTCLGGGGNDPGYPYPGGGGEDPQPEPYDPCEKGKDLLKPSKGNIKTLITNGMYSYINNSSTGEAGIYLKKDNLGNITSEVAPYTAGAALPIKTGGKYFSAIHTHPTDAYPMFSWTDIYALYKLEIQSAQYNEGYSSLLLVCQDDNGVKQTYVIMFENIGSYMEDVFNNPENIGCSHQEIKDRMDLILEDKYKKEADKSVPNYESAFLQVTFGTNVGLYKANADLSGFSKLEIQSNIADSIVIPINCN
ncbi:hypothetical protein [Chryseobacterium camelliae]|uniref:hypothetical protein n=1 Tax=Chryseobacterium camelliae TaxID=1265445 RepID=UPI0012FD6AA7|nr:hypothetical protein [Chryseobacterium camelliae]